MPKADTDPRTNDRAIKRLIAPTKRELLSSRGMPRTERSTEGPEWGIWMEFLLSGRGKGEKVEREIIRLGIGLIPTGYLKSVRAAPNLTANLQDGFGTHKNPSNCSLEQLQSLCRSLGIERNKSN